MLSRLHIGPKTWGEVGIVLLALVAAAGIGYASLVAPNIALFIPFLPLALLILTSPAIGLYLFIPIGQLVPYWVRAPLPVFNSPLEVVALCTAIATAAYWARHHKAWPRSWLYLPLFVSASILGLAWFTGYGQEADARFYTFIVSLLPFFPVVLVIDSPRRARILLLSITLPLLIRAAAVWPIVLFYGGESGSVFRQTQIIDDWLYWLWGFRGANLPLTLSFLCPVILALMFLAPRKRLRIFLMLLALAITGALLLTTFRAALVNLGVAIIVVAVLGPERLRHRVLGFALLLGGLLVFVGLLGDYARGVQGLLDNWQNTVVDPLLRGNIWVDRLAMLRNDLEVFRRSPWAGVGAITPVAHGSELGQVELESQIFYLYGHNSISMIASEYGIALLLPWSALFLVTGWTLLRLYRAVRHSLDRGLVVGFFGIWAIVLLQAFINTTLFQILPMHIFWTCMGLAVVWNEWLQSSPGTRLVDWEW